MKSRIKLSVDHIEAGQDELEMSKGSEDVDFPEEEIIYNSKVTLMNAQDDDVDEELRIVKEWPSGSPKIKISNEKMPRTS